MKRASNTPARGNITHLCLALTLALTGTIARAAAPLDQAPAVLGPSAQRASVQAGLPSAVDPAVIERLRAAARGAVVISAQKGTNVAGFVRIAKGGDLHPGNPSTTPRGKTIGFFAEHGALFGMKNAATELVFERSDSDAHGATHLSYTQHYRGVPVFAAVLKAHLDAQNRLTAVNGVFVPAIDLDITPRLSTAEAAARAVADVLANPPESDSTGEATPLSARDLSTLPPVLYVYRDGLVQGIEGRNRLVYEIEVGNGSSVREKVYIDAHSGKLVNRITQIHDVKYRRLYEQNVNTQVWQEGDPLPGALNADQVNIVDFSGDSYHYFFNAFGRDSYDGAGAEMRSVNNDPRINCPNANWNGFTTNYCNGVTADDIVAHEWGHAYTQHTHNLIYQWQSGALNEAYSDIWGEAVDLLNGVGSDAHAPRSVGTCSVYTPPVSLTEVVVHSPVSIAAGYPGAPSTFGAPLPATGVSGSVVRALDDAASGSTTDGCAPLLNGADISGNIALIDRGTCSFTVKIRNAQDAGAIAVIVADNVAGTHPGMTGSDPAITIPSLIVTLATGNALKGALADGVSASLSTQVFAAEDSYRWLLAEDSSAFGGALRDMWNPACKGNPGKVSDSTYWCTSGDNGGVHMNSGVPNHAFALLVDGGDYNGRSIAALGLIKAAHLYWQAQAVYQTPTTDFAGHADALQASCQDLLGIPLEGLSTTAEPAGPSGQALTAEDCAAVDAVIEAAELRANPVQCGFQPLLQPNAPAVCGDVRRPQTLFTEDFENGLLGWTSTSHGLGPDWPALDWVQNRRLPGQRAGSAAFAADPNLGDCANVGISGRMSLESPVITLPDSATSARHVISFEHYVATEYGYDGGNLNISVNGGDYIRVPASAITFNPYNATLYTAGQGNTNPLAGQPAYTGTDRGRSTGSWGQSQIDVTALGVQPGDTLRLRYDFGIDTCFGYDGWYVDDVAVTACHDPVLATTTLVSCPDSQPYTGAAQTPCTATVNADDDFSETLTVSYSDNVAAGIATATATFAGTDRYTGSSASATFVIEPVESVVQLICPDSVGYTGAALTPCTASVSGADGVDEPLAVIYSDNVNAGTATATAVFAGDANHTGSSATRTFGIDPAASTTAVTCPASVTYTGAAQTPCTATVTGVGGLNQALTVDYSDNVLVGTAAASAAFAGDANHAASAGSVHFAIDRAVITVTADDAETVYGEALPAFGYTLSGFIDGDSAALVSGSASCATTATVASPVGDYPISCGNGTLAAQNYRFAFVDGTLTITPRDALARYIGDTTWVSSGANSTAAQVTLTASVQDPTGAGLAAATLDFIDAMSGAVLARNVTVRPVDNAPGIGTANAVVTLGTGQYGAESYLVLVRLSGNYDNTAQSIDERTATLLVARPAATGTTTGAGTFAALASAAGTYAGNGDDAAFSVGMKYTKKGTSVQGQITLAVPQADGVIYVKSNSISSMAMKAGTPKTATIYTKASIHKVQGDGTVITLDGNVTLRMDVADGSPDKVGFTVLSSKDGQLYYSNQWLLSANAWKTVIETLKTGFVTLN